MGRLVHLRNQFKEKKISHKEYYEALLPKIKEKNKKINALLEIFEEEILEEVKEWTLKKIESASPRSLLGVPLAIKDMISIENHQLSAASRMLEGYRAPRSATVIEKLTAADALYIGRAHCDEFAMGSSNENTPFHPVCNPFDLTRTPGGSSGGSGAAVAAEMCVGSLGTDTGGSVRLPAAFCGLVAIKPTYGRVSRSGVIAFASSLDQVGPIADDAIDCATLLEIISGHDPRDATSFPVPVDSYVEAVKKGTLKGIRMGLPKEFFTGEGLDSEIQKMNDEALTVFKKEGATLVDVSLPHTPYGIAVYYLIATAEASSNLSRYDGIRYGHRTKNNCSMKELIIQSRSEGFGPEVKRRIMLGTFSLSSGYYDAYYQKAQFVRSKIQNEFLEALKEVDILFIPTSPTLPFRLKEKINDPLQMYLTDIFTVSINLAGMPAVAFPLGLTAKNLSVGGQFIGAPFQEGKILGCVGAFEKAHPISKGKLQC